MRNVRVVAALVLAFTFVALANSAISGQAGPAGSAGAVPGGDTSPESRNPGLAGGIRFRAPTGRGGCVSAACHDLGAGSSSNLSGNPGEMAAYSRYPHYPYAPSSTGHTIGSGPIEPDLLRAMEMAGPSDAIPVIVRLRDQANLSSEIGSSLSRSEARSRVVGALQSTADRSQASLRAYLADEQAAGLVESYTPLWIFNGIAVRARPPVIQRLASDPAVASVGRDHWRAWVDVDGLGAGSWRQSSQSVEWGVEHLRADEVWASLNISGTDVVVAGLDTGVDWLHPALQATYRGFGVHGPSIHSYSWHDATGSGALYPMDGHGHGTHTMGTVVGQDGIGLAPGANWIGVRVLDSQGNGYDSWIHAGFQWILAPGGDPSQAPDVVNCSWGNDNGALTTFQPDLRALRAADVLAVFSNGNAGPNSGTVGSPAALPEAFSVGAIDSRDVVAAFSSRGPSHWGDIRPDVAAPGVSVRSSLPGGTYGLSNGSSMAAPHVSGVAALLRSVSPTVSITHTVFLITSTAVPLSGTVPNNDTGWGRVDAYAAVAALLQPAFITGTVTRAADGVPIVGAAVIAARHRSGGGGTATTTDNGQYTLALASGTYDLTASAFGYLSADVTAVTVTTGANSVRSFSLGALPSGSLRGMVSDAATGQAIVGTVAVLDTPLEAMGSSYDFSLPAGTYTVRARKLGFRVVSETAVVHAEKVTTLDLALPEAPTLLLVDSGEWHYSSQASYFRQALDDLAYAYDEWSVYQLPDDVPTASDLKPYDAVVWSAPEDAPGYIGAQSAVTGYLSTGGRLLLSGQDVGYLDGGGVDFEPYYRDFLKVQWVQDDAGIQTLEGVPGELFSGLTITIAGSGGADNQDFPDEIVVADADSATPVLTYQGAGCGGVRVGTCLDYKVVYLAFGLEGIASRSSRREVMDRALSWLGSEPPDSGLELVPTTQTGVGVPGTFVTHTVRVRHLGQGGPTDAIGVSVEGALWPTQLDTPSLSLAPCASATIGITVAVPADADWDSRDVATLRVQSSLSAALVQTAVLVSKAPAPILLVDDDRWYDQEAKYEAALEASGLSYDYWSTKTSRMGQEGRSPPLDVLQKYPVVVWFTGYDWYAPVTSEEEATLSSYLEGGGRLYLSSQDFLYYHYGDPFAEARLGVLSHTEDVTPTVARGVPGDLIGDGLGRHPLEYPFRNWSDALTPTPGTSIPFRDQARRGIALARREGGHATVFSAFPFETLPEEARPRVMAQVIGWLSALGSSSMNVDRGAVSSGELVTYTVALRNDSSESITASFSNTLPVSLSLVPGTLHGPAAYDRSAQLVSWDGRIGPGAAVTIAYQASVAADVAAGTAITNTARLGLKDHRVRFTRFSVVRVGAPDLSESLFGFIPGSARPGALVTGTLTLISAGPVSAPGATAAISLPVEATLVPDSLSWEGGGTAEALTNTVCWSGSVDSLAQITLTVQLALPGDLLRRPLYGVAFVEDGAGGDLERATWIDVTPARIYLPQFLTAHVVAPDLIVDHISSPGSGVQVIIGNQGNASVTDEFWVDVYIDPKPKPTRANQTWDQLGHQGLTWGVSRDALPLYPVTTMTLTVGDDYYRPALSRVAWPIAPRTPVFAQVDSANAGVPHGAILETHEVLEGHYNNIGHAEVPTLPDDIPLPESGQAPLSVGIPESAPDGERLSRRCWKKRCD